MKETFIPNLVCHKETQVIRTLAEFWIPQFRLKEPVRIYCVDQVRGKAFYRHRVITIPKWVLRDLDYTNEYIIHELSHMEDVDTRGRSDHKAPFWEIFKRVCPQKWWHYEWKYKPQQTQSAGMTMLDVFDTPTGKKHADELGENDV